MSSTVLSVALMPQYRAELLEIEPSRCKAWPYHNRDSAWLTHQCCADLIKSIRSYGQMEPAIVRALQAGSEPSFEIISGVRRWFACSQIPHRKLLVRIIDADDRTCMMLMHAENANIQAITEFERACSLAAHMKSGVFKNQMDLATSLGLSQSTISKMIKAAEMFEKSWFAQLFDNKLDILIRQTYRLSALLKKPGLGAHIEAEAQVILDEKNKAQSPMPARLILQRLIRCVKKVSKTSIDTLFSKEKILSTKD